MSCRNRPIAVVLLASALGVLPDFGGHRAEAQEVPIRQNSQSPATSAPLIDPVRLERAHRRLVRVSATLEGNVSLAHLLSLVLVTDDEDSRATSAEEHRAALFVVAFFVNQWPIERLVAEARAWPKPAPRRVTLGGRRDHAQHFSLSAAMAAVVGTPLAEAVAIFKELRDAQGRSGFSFSDVLANRAGQRFGGLAAGPAAGARSLSDRRRSGLVDRDIMPAIDGLPDDLPKAEFTRRFGSVGSAAYNAVVADIDARIGRLPLYQ